jgi:hypothetical protein
MGFFSDIVSAVCSVGGAICSGISSACLAIGGGLFAGVGGISTIATALVTPFVSLPVAEILVVIQAVSSIVSFIAEAIGIKDVDETPEELGLKAEQADKKPEDFESIETYIEYLRKEIQLDKEKLNGLSIEEKVGYGAIGTALYIKGLEENYGVNMNADFWDTTRKLDMKGNEVKAYLDNFKANRITDMNDMTAYIKRQPLEDGKARSQIGSVMLNTLRELNPEASENELTDKLLTMKLT